MSTEESLKLKLKKKIKLGTGKSKRSAGDSEVQGFRRSSKDHGTENQFRKQRDVRLTDREKPERSGSSGERNTRSYGKSDKGYSKSSKDYNTDNKWRKPRNVQLRDGERPERSESSGQRHRQSYDRTDKGYSKSSNDYSNGDRDRSSGNNRRNQRDGQFTEGEKPERSASYGQRNRQNYGRSDNGYSNGDRDYSSGNHRRDQRNEQFTEGEKPERSASYGQRNRQNYGRSDNGYSNGDRDYSSGNHKRDQRNEQFTEGEKPERSASYGQRNRQNYGRSDNAYGKSNRDYNDRNKDYSTDDRSKNQRNGRLTEGEKPYRLSSYDQRNKRVYAKPDKVMEEKNYSHDKDTSKNNSSREGRFTAEKRSSEGRSNNRAELPADLKNRENKKPWKLKLKTEALAQKDTKNKSSELTPITFPKQRLRDKRANDPSADDEKPKKKKKRVIRIDPYDTSNKRLDDGIVDNESIKETKKEAKDDVEMSRNAQFRAIQPSPSILSFVEDNMLGRRRTIDFRRAGYNTELSAPLDNVPFWTESERARVEENVFRNKLTFYAAAKVSSSFPPPELPEIAFAGRSNVGKSSMLNALTRQWGVVRTSDKPGLTQTINFFQLGPKLSLVDLPGYGFAYAKEEVKDAWEELVKEYVSTRTGLKRVCLLIDTKWGMKPRDLELIELMERSQTKYQVVLTKTDLVFPIDVARRAMQIEESLKAKKSIVQPLMMVSSHTGGGIGCLRKVLAKVARFAKV